MNPSTKLTAAQAGALGGKIGGRSRSQSKAWAARINGAKGGRKPKTNGIRCPECGKPLVDIGGYWGCLCSTKDPIWDKYRQGRKPNKVAKSAGGD